jgi:3-hydroxymyristoyl/3-hydroxydecanoyl-(acyl carrier protein) dehydratase
MQDKEVKMKAAGQADILELIPQRPPFVMVDRLVSVEGRSATSVFLVKEGNIFVKQGRFQESGLMENIAQTAAAMEGFRARSGGGELKNGYIGGIKNLEINALPAVGTVLTTVVTESNFVMNTSIVNGQVMAGDQVIARCEMKISLP